MSMPKTRKRVSSDEPPRWHHVTPLFLLGKILESGGIKCGADVEAEGLPRRPSSCDENEARLKALGDRRPSDCILLFTKPIPNLLKAKLSNTRKPGAGCKAYPHVVLSVCAAACLKASKYTIFGSTVNVRRALRRDVSVGIEPFRSYTAVRDAKIEELLLPADLLDGRVLPVSAIRAIRCFSPADGELVQQHLRWSGHQIEVELDDEPGYVEGQSHPPGSEFLDLTKRLYEAKWHRKKDQVSRLRAELASTCFD
jgi:hypothetical protein